MLIGVKKERLDMHKHKILKTLPVIGLRATEEEQKMFNLIRKVRRIPSNSHVIRLLVTEEYEKILSNDTPNGITQKTKS